MVLLTMVEEHLANTRLDSGDFWKPVKVCFTFFSEILDRALSLGEGGPGSLVPAPHAPHA